ncbi:dTDP-4-dehydrorhamnose 3,5-epimerase [Pusillimonas sp. CC-YST705]|uniref:dTDP-4-dehydrorhamnose 3,5-epimerase n=1 Tax=Mesopusillimonas faecipullorum TaxID=2755040 RepID=A0ABS8CEX1_9BURK|nr:dTDP-4-dehydrorhamnose 3,5-epimerase [Mesopusillimonas faecipullorum]MCB5364119.1 dTDP-4-dehydrorhamnose 3,5-epimerase [Mesopusillimonas faecipullorum]
MLPNLIDTRLPDVKLLAPRVYADARGHFMESARQAWGALLPGFSGAFVQSNVSLSHQHVLRGLHFQRAPAQGKLLHVLQGEIFDVVVDVRRASPRFGQMASFQLSASKHELLWVPPGYAHGFLVLSEQALVSYQCTAYYSPESEVCLHWNDAALAIAWPVATPLVSERDACGQSLQALQKAGLCL